MPDVIIVTETWLNDAISDCELLPSGYHTFCHDHGLRGGGVLVAVSFCLTSFLLFKSHLSETLVVKILSSPPLHLACAYIPPSSSADAYLDVISSSLPFASSDGHFLLVGDLTFPM